MIRFKHTTIYLASLSCLATFSHTVLAVDYTVYGKAEVQIANTDTGTMRYADECTQIDAPFSRIGIKGEHKLNEYLSVVFKYEVQVKGLSLIHI